MKNLKLNSESRIRENSGIKIFSIQGEYIILAAIFSIMGIITAKYFGLGAKNIMAQGTWFVLGGFSLFYPVIVLVLPVYLYMLIYAISTAKSVRLSFSDEQFAVKERFSYLKSETVSFSLSEIIRIRLLKGSMGFKYVYVLLFTLHMLYLGPDGVMLLVNPLTFGYGYSNAILYISSALMDLLSITLIARGDILLEIYLSDGSQHVLKIHPIFKRNRIFQQIGNVFDAIFIKDLESNAKSQDSKSRSILMAPKYYGNPSALRFITGILFIVISVISKFLYVFAGGVLRVLLFLCGIFYIIFSLKNGIGGKFEVNLTSNAEQNDDGKSPAQNRSLLVIHNKYKWSEINEYATINVDNSGEEESLMEILESVEKGLEPGKVPFLDAFMLPFLLVFLGWTVVNWFKFLSDSVSFPIVINTIALISGFIIVVFFCLSILSVPRRILSFNSETGPLEIRISFILHPIPINGGEEYGKNAIFKDFIETFRLIHLLFKDKRMQKIMIVPVYSALVFLFTGFILGFFI